MSETNVAKSLAARLAQLGNRPAASTAANKPRVLLVDDEERILRTLDMLLRMQYQVFTTTDGHEALRILQRERIHLLISDQRMPLMTGTEVLRQARELSPNTTRILLTGYADMDAAMAAVNDGEIFRYIHKPWGPKELRDTVADAVAVAQQLEAVPVAALHSAPVQGLTVLVLDSDASVYECVREMLGSQHRVQWRTTQASALELLASEPVAVLVTELELDDGDASVMLKTLKQEYPEVQTVVHTSFKDSMRVAQLVNQAQVFRYLPKPTRKGLLGRSLEAALARCQQVREVPQLRAAAAQVEKTQDVTEQTASSRIREYLARLRARGTGNSGLPVAGTV